MPLFTEAGPLQADLLQKRRQKTENASCLLLTSEKGFARYHVANFLPTYFICTETEQPLGKYSVISVYGSVP